MTRVGTARLTTSLVAAALAAGAGGVLPTSARADDGAPGAALPPEVVAVAPSLDADDALAVVEDGLAAAIDVADDVDAVLPPVEASEDVPSAPETVEGDAQVPEADEAPGAAAEAETQEKSQEQTDTVSDTTSAAGSPSPSAAQASPANVNVSVRIGSSGDNGPVTQVNLAAALAPSPSAAPTGAAERSASSGAGANPVQDGAGAQPVVSPGGSTAISPASAGAGAWTWQWDCMSAPTFDGVSPAGSDSGSIPSNWTWIWNCGGNTDQYQSATVGQYHPINVNVSIRVGSPGNDGAVKQSNVAVGVSVGSTHTPPAADPPPADSPSFPESTAPGITLPQLPALAVVASVAVLSPVAAVIPELAEEILTVEEAIDLLVPSLTGARSFPLAPAVAARSLGGGSALRAAPFTIGPRGELAATRPALGPTGSPVPALRAPATDAHPAAPPSSASRSTKRASRWKVPAGTSSAPERAPSGTSASAAGAGGSASGSLPIFLALPFLAALLDLARRVALERFATPSGQRSRIPDTPG
jgi:hypothetical protein